MTNLNPGVAQLLTQLSTRLNVDSATDLLGKRPGQSMLTLLGLSTVVFYQAEKNRNPKVHDIWDALVYCSTCLSVGYSDIFAKTPLGKIAGSTLMTLGPSLTARATDGRKDLEQEALQRQTLDTLTAILAELRLAREAKSEQPSA